MVFIQNPDATQVIRDQAKITLSEGVPQNLLPNVQPVMDMTPRFHRNTDVLGTQSKTSTGNQTIFTSHTARDTYITGIALGLVKDASCDVAIGRSGVSVVIDGTTTTIVALPVLTLTAQEQSIFATFDRPVKIDRGTQVLITTSTYTAGLMSRSATVYGYTLS